MQVTSEIGREHNLEVGLAHNMEEARAKEQVLREQLIIRCTKTVAAVPPNLSPELFQAINCKDQERLGSREDCSYSSHQKAKTDLCREMSDLTVANISVLKRNSLENREVCVAHSS